MLREELSKISKIIDEKNCSEELSQLQKKYNHTISIIISPRSLNEFNCFEYALGLSDLDAYIEMKKRLYITGFGSVFCNSYFMQWLIDNKFITRGGNLILYKNMHNDIKHAGIMANDGLISSKWGTGCLYHHQPLEIPSEYPERTLNYNNLEANLSFQYFKNYLKKLEFTINMLVEK